MAFTVKDWKNYPDTTTPLSAEALEDLEKRVTDYAESENAHLKLATAADKKVSFGSTSVSLDSTSGLSKGTTSSVAHGLGSTPTYVLATAQSVVGITEDGGTTDHAVWVVCKSKDGTNMTFQAEVNGTSNNSVTIHWVAVV